MQLPDPAKFLARIFQFYPNSEDFKRKHKENVMSKSSEKMYLQNCIEYAMILNHSANKMSSISLGVNWYIRTPFKFEN